MSLKSFPFFNHSSILPLKQPKDENQKNIQRLFNPKYQKETDPNFHITDFDYDRGFFVFGDSQGCIHLIHKETFQGILTQSFDKQFTQKVHAVKFLYNEGLTLNEWFILSIGTDEVTNENLKTPEEITQIEKKKPVIRVFQYKVQKNAAQPKKLELLSETPLIDAPISEDIDINAIDCSIQGEFLAVSVNTSNHQYYGSILFFKREIYSGNKWQYKFLQKLNVGVGTSLQFSKILKEKTNCNFYITTDETSNSVLRYNVAFNLSSKLGKPIELDKTRGCPKGCASSNLNDDLILSNRNGIFVYKEDQTQQTSRSLNSGEKKGISKAIVLLNHQLQEDPVFCLSVGKYVILVTKNENDPEAINSKQILTVFQFEDHYKAFEKSFSMNVIKVIEDSSNKTRESSISRFFIFGKDLLTGEFILSEIEEKEPIEQRDLLIKKYEYDLAIRLTSNSQKDEDFKIDTIQKYGNYLFSKGKYTEAVREYIKTIGELEPSHVIRKFLDSQRNENLIEYLEALHEKGQANEEHTTLLLNCYTRLQITSPFQKANETKGNSISENNQNSEQQEENESKKYLTKTHERIEMVRNRIQSFLYRHPNAKKPNYDTKTAIKILRSSGYQDLALELAQKFHHDKFVIQIQLEDFDERYSELSQDYVMRALQHLESLPFKKAAKFMKFFGKNFISRAPQYATNVLIRLCTKWNSTPFEKEDRSIKTTGITSTTIESSSTLKNSVNAIKKTASSLFFGVDTSKNSENETTKENPNGEENLENESMDDEDSLDENEDDDFGDLDTEDEDEDEDEIKKKRRRRRKKEPQYIGQAEEYIFAFADQQYWLMIFLENVIVRIRSNPLSKILPHKLCYNTLLELYLKYYTSLEDINIEAVDYYDLIHVCNQTMNYIKDPKHIIPFKYSFQKNQNSSNIHSVKDTENQTFNYRIEAPEPAFYTMKFSRKVMHLLEMSRHMDHVLYDDEHALVLVQSKQIEEGILYMYEKLELYYDIIQHFMEKTETINLNIDLSVESTTDTTVTDDTTTSNSESGSSKTVNNEKKLEKLIKEQEFKIELLSSIYNEIIHRCVKYGENDPNMWMQVLSFFSNKIGTCITKKSSEDEDSDSDSDDDDDETESETATNASEKKKQKQQEKQKLQAIQEELLLRHKSLLEEKVGMILEHISKSNILPPLLVVQILAEQNNTELTLVKDFLVQKLETEQKEIEKYSQDILSLQKDTKKLNEEIEELKTSAKVFQLTTCSACSEQLDLPAVHFMCGHSFHQRCLDDKEECPKCGKKNRQAVTEAKKILDVDANEQFFKQLKTSSINPEKGFDTIATWFGRILIKNTEEEQK